MSTFSVDVVPVTLEPHPHADSLSIVRVFGYQVIVRTEDWRDRPLGAYVPPDSVVPDTDAFAFLDGHTRIKVRRFRGLYSQGLLIAAPPGSVAGDDVAEHLGIIHYEPPIRSSLGAGDDIAPPPGFRPAYDIEQYRRYPHLLPDGLPVVVTEKLHGASGRWCFVDGRLWAGSRNRWKKQSPRDLWWYALNKTPALQRLLEEQPALTAYGEVYGDVQELRYGLKRGDADVRLFDLWSTTDHRWLDWSESNQLREHYDLPWVPVLHEGPFSAAVLDLAEGQSTIAEHVREGVVVRPVVEQIDPTIGRLQLKIISNQYLEQAK